MSNHFRSVRGQLLFLLFTEKKAIKVIIFTIKCYWWTFHSKLMCTEGSQMWFRSEIIMTMIKKFVHLLHTQCECNFNKSRVISLIKCNQKFINLCKLIFNKLCFWTHDTNDIREVPFQSVTTRILIVFCIIIILGQVNLVMFCHWPIEWRRVSY